VSSLSVQLQQSLQTADVQNDTIAALSDVVATLAASVSDLVARLATAERQLAVVDEHRGLLQDSTAHLAQSQTVLLELIQKNTANDAEEYITLANTTSSVALELHEFAAAVTTELRDVKLHLGAFQSDTGADLAALRSTIDNMPRPWQRSSMEFVFSTILGPDAARYVTQCYRRSMAGGSAGAFHTSCDGKGAWSFLLLTFDNGNRFAFATDQVWAGSSGTYRVSEDARVFVFPSDNSSTAAVFAANRPEYSSYDNFAYGPVLGGGNDFVLNADLTTGECIPHSWLDAQAASRGGYLAGSQRDWRVVDMLAFYYDFPSPPPSPLPPPPPAPRPQRVPRTPASLAGATVTTIAGVPGMVGSVDGSRLEATFANPTGVVVDEDGTVFVADAWNQLIRKIDANGNVTTFAGQRFGVDGNGLSSTDGVGTAAKFNYPFDVVFGPDRRMYVADRDGQWIRVIAADGMVTTLAGSGRLGSDDGPAMDASFLYPTNLAVGPDGTVYVTEMINSVIRAIKDGQVTTFAGLAGSYGAADGRGTAASFASPTGIALCDDGSLYVADHYNHIIRRVTPDGEVTTLAGVAGVRGANDGVSTSASFSFPVGLACDARGLFVADSRNNLIRHVDMAGNVTTLSLLPGGGIDGLCVPYGISTSTSDGSLYVANLCAFISKITWDATSFS
jgi:hypothetical protein